MKRLLATLVLIQAAGAIAGVIAAGQDIESILTSGPLLFTAGLISTQIAYRTSRPVGLFLGLAGPTIVVCCGAWIIVMGWGPHGAQRPVFFALLAVSVPYLALAALALRDLSADQGNSRDVPRFQFNVAALLTLMLMVAVPLALHRALGQRGSAVGILVVWWLFASYVIRRFYLRRPSPAVDEPPAALADR